MAAFCLSPIPLKSGLSGHQGEPLTSSYRQRFESVCCSSCPRIALATTKVAPFADPQPEGSQPG